MKRPSCNDRAVKVSAYLTDEVFGYEHWRAAQFSAPDCDKYGLLLLFDTAAERDRAAEAWDPPLVRPDREANLAAALEMIGALTLIADNTMGTLRAGMTQIRAICDQSLQSLVRPVEPQEAGE